MITLRIHYDIHMYTGKYSTTVYRHIMSTVHKDHYTTIQYRVRDTVHSYQHNIVPYLFKIDIDLTFVQHHIGYGYLHRKRQQRCLTIGPSLPRVSKKKEELY